jgi:cytochrome c556
MTRVLFAAPLLALLAACSGAEADAPPVIKERHENFEAIGDSFKAIRAQLEGDPDMSVILAAASDINARAAKIEGHFPAGTGVDAGWDTEALATIWEKPTEFTDARLRLLDESLKLVEIAAEGDTAVVGEQVGKLGEACKSCHDSFRVKDE